MQNKVKRSKIKPKRKSKDNNRSNKIKKEDQEAKKILLGKKKLSMKEAKQRGYQYKKVDSKNMEIAVLKKIRDSYQQHLIRQFQTIKEGAKGAFKCTIHKFDTNYYDEWNRHLFQKKHFINGTLMCKKCNNPKTLNNFPITKQLLIKAKRLRCDHCKKYLMIRMFWGDGFPTVVG